MKIQRLIAWTALVFGLACARAEATTLSQVFINDYASNAVYLFSDDAANLTFTKMKFGGDAAGWSVTSNTGDELVLGGPVLTPNGGLFTLTMKYTSLPFSYQWAEVLTGSPLNSILDAGTLKWDGHVWTASDTFTHFSAINPGAPVPVPSSAWLLGSALVGLICIGRGSRRHQ